MRIFIITLFVLSGMAVQSQTRIDTIFSNLKTGGILVRLKTNENTLKALQGKNDKLAERIIQERDKRNLMIINAFKKFSYCEVYFFYDTNSISILEQKFNHVLFDENFQKVQMVSLDNNYLIANFNTTIENKDTVEYDNILYSSRNSEGKLRVNNAKVLYSTDMEGGVDALTLYLPDFIELQAPFPYYARTYENLPFITRSYDETVLRLQYKIVKYMETRYPK